MSSDDSFPILVRLTLRQKYGSTRIQKVEVEEHRMALVGVRWERALAYYAGQKKCCRSESWRID